MHLFECSVWSRWQHWRQNKIIQVCFGRSSHLGAIDLNCSLMCSTMYGPLGWVSLPFFTELKKLYFVLSVILTSSVASLIKLLKMTLASNISFFLPPLPVFCPNIWVLYINTILNVLTLVIVHLRRNGRYSPLHAKASPFKNNLSSMHDVAVTSQLLTVHLFVPRLNFFVLLLCCVHVPRVGSPVCL